MTCKDKNTSKKLTTYGWKKKKKRTNDANQETKLPKKKIKAKFAKDPNNKELLVQIP